MEVLGQSNLLYLLWARRLRNKLGEGGNLCAIDAVIVKSINELFNFGLAWPHLTVKEDNWKDFKPENTELAKYILLLINFYRRDCLRWTVSRSTKTNPALRLGAAHQRYMLNSPRSLTHWFALRLQRRGGSQSCTPLWVLFRNTVSTSQASSSNIVLWLPDTKVCTETDG